jgi:hypothetical protein
MAVAQSRGQPLKHVRRGAACKLRHPLQDQRLAPCIPPSSGEYPLLQVGAAGAGIPGQEPCGLGGSVGTSRAPCSAAQAAGTRARPDNNAADCRSLGQHVQAEPCV